MVITVAIQLSLLPFKAVENGAGGGDIAWPAGPSPLPVAPWHAAHFSAYESAALGAAIAVCGPAAIKTAIARNSIFPQLAGIFLAIVRLLEAHDGRLQKKRMRRGEVSKQNESIAVSALALFKNARSRRRAKDWCRYRSALRKTACCRSCCQNRSADIRRGPKQCASRRIRRRDRKRSR